MRSSNSNWRGEATSRPGSPARGSSVFTIGLDAVHTAELGMSTAADGTIMARARTDGRVVITYDSDFHQILAHTGALAPSVIRMRDDRLPFDETVNLIAAAVAQFPAALASGVALTIHRSRFCVRELPLEQ